mgnify:CR=1 FL=1
MKQTIRKIICILLVICLVYSYRYELFFNEVDNIASSAIIIAILIYIVIKNINNDINNLTTKELSMKWIIILLLSLLWAKTFNKYIFPIETGFSLKTGFDSAITLVQAFALLIVTINTIQNFTFESQRRNASWQTIINYSIPSILISIIIWLSIYPALMIVDSVYIWTMIDGLMPYNDIHPITYTIMLKLLTLVWNSPASIALVQILLTGLAIGFTGYSLQRIGLPLRYCWIAILLASLLPVTWLYSVTIIKDTFYTMSLLIFIDIIVLAVNDPNYILCSIKWYIFGGLAGLLVILSRHNGILTICGTLIIALIMFLIKKNRSWVIKTACTLLSILFLFYSSLAIIKTSLGENFIKQDASPLLYTHPIHHVVTIYREHNSELDKETLSDIDRFLNLNYLYPYLFGEKAYDWIQGYYFQNIQLSGDWSEISKDSVGFFRLWLRLIKAYPKTAYTASQRLSSIVWYSSNYGFTTTYILGIYHQDGYANIIESPILPQVKSIIQDSLERLDNIWLLWRPAWALVLCLVLAYIAVKRKGAKSMFILLPTILNSLGLLIAVPYPDTRFVYINFYTLIVFAIYTLLCERKEAVAQIVPSSQAS